LKKNKLNLPRSKSASQSRDAKTTEEVEKHGDPGVYFVISSFPIRGFVEKGLEEGS